MKLNYYTLMIDWDRDGNFSPEFGDWNIAVVHQERIDSYEGKSFKIDVTLESMTAGIEYIKANNPYNTKENTQ